MKTDRNIQVLMAGLKAAHERMFSDAALRRPEYVRDLQRLYSNMEDALYVVFDFIKEKKYVLVREKAADIIVAASEMVEYAELLANAADSFLDKHRWKEAE
jgi:hypothetical protein